MMVRDDCGECIGCGWCQREDFGREVEVEYKLADRLRCKYNGRDFGGKIEVVLPTPIMLEAAQEIDRLTAANADLQQRLDAAEEALKVAQGEVEQRKHWDSLVCSRCHGIGEITVMSGQTPENFSQDNIPCPDCIGPVLDEHDKALTAANSRVERLREALDELARLGNEPHFGNSCGNLIARKALADDAKEGK